MSYLLADLSSEVDWSGIYGGIFHYGMIIAFAGSALIAFIYFWSKGKLDMDEEPKLQMMRTDDQEIHVHEDIKHVEEHDAEVELYGDPRIASKNAPVPRWLIAVNIFCILIGLFGFYFFWNGSHGWLDRGYWSQLQRAANTTYPYTTLELVDKEAAEKQVASMKDHN